MAGIQKSGRELKEEAGASPAGSIKIANPGLGAGGRGCVYKGGRFCHQGLGAVALASLEGGTFKQS